jgi:transglutaminase-like putative cysteine protease
VSEAWTAALGARDSLRGRPAAQGRSRQRTVSSPSRESVGLRLTAFAALATFAAMQWVALVVDPPVGRAAVAVGVAVAGAAGLASIARAPIGRAPAWVLALVASLVALAATALAIGVPARLLTPGHWGELGDRLTGGLNAIGHDDYPYSGGNEWARLAILFGLPLWLGLAAALAFWPRRRAAPARVIPALVILVGAYATAATVNPPGAPLWHGLALLALVAAWLWLPGLRRGDALAAGAVVLAAGAIALPLAARLDGAHPWLDYENWEWAWSSVSSGESFSWDHSYGPLDWPRSGKTLLEVKSDAPHYWRTAVLDEFDGFRWAQSHDSGQASLELPRQALATASSLDLSGLDHDWLHRIRFTVRSLHSELVIGAGTVLSIEGLYGVTPTSGGLVLPPNDPLEDGNTYTVQAYVPDPTADQMAASPRRYPRALARYTRIDLPQKSPLAVPLRGGAQPSSVAPRVGVHDDATTSRLLASSPYGQMYGLAHRLTDRKPTTYDAVNAIEDYLQRNYTYNESPPQHKYPLPAFLFDDRSGYCQQFSGAMALMLRMVGIPSRIAAGFSAGQPNRGRGYAVRDLDAHSWVEVYFNGIGWVAFDPTPAVAPAQSQTSGLGLLRFPTNVLGGKASPKGTGGSHRVRVDRPAAAGSSPAIPLWALPVGLALVCAAAGIGLAARATRDRSLSPPAAAEARLRELEAALARLRSWSAGGTTLLALERRLASVAGPAAAGYAAKLRAARYAPGDPSQPTTAERRAMRRELTSGLGLRARLRGFLAIPPGGPSPV